MKNHVFIKRLNRLLSIGSRMKFKAAEYALDNDRKAFSEKIDHECNNPILCYGLCRSLQFNNLKQVLMFVPNLNFK